MVGLCATLYLSSLSISQSSTLCELFGTDCATVALSSFGSVLGFSTASFGLGYFVCQLVFLGFLIIKPKELSGIQLSVMPALCLNLAACISSLAFVIILFAVLKQSCFACMIVHVVNFLTFPLNFYAWKKSEARASRLVPVFISILLGIISVLVVHVVDIRYMLAVSDEQARNYLELVLNKYDQAEKYTFKREFGDAIY